MQDETQTTCKVLQDFYGLSSDKIIIKKLNGYENINYKIKNQDNQKSYLLKTYMYCDSQIEQLKAENDVLITYFSNKKNQGNKEYLTNISEPLPNNEGQYLTIQGNVIYRLLSWIEGDLISDITPHSYELLYSLGKIIGEMDYNLSQITNLYVKSNIIQWDLQHFLMNEKYLEYIKNQDWLKVILHYIEQYKLNVLPVQYQLRKQIIHNDLNDYNILVDGKNNKIAGIIDFGDMVYSYTICELAICCTYLAFDKADPLQAILPLIQGFDEIMNLQIIELEILYYLIAARLATSLLNSSYQQTLDPQNEYIRISQRPGWELLQQWLRISPIYAANQFISSTKIGKQQESQIKQQDSSIERIIQQRHKNISKSYSLCYKEPILVSSSIFQYMHDQFGNTYLDSYNNIYHVGHQHPRIIAAGYKQMNLFNGNMRYLHQSINTYSEKLLALFPDSLSKVFYVNSGSAATDLALRLAKNHNKKQKIIVIEYGYHGNTVQGIEISAYKYKGKGGSGKSNNIIELPLPNKKMCPQEYLETCISIIEPFKDEICCLITEPIIGCGGQVEFPPQFLQKIYEYVRKNGGITISDEVQTGFGRLGCEFNKNYWGFQKHNVVPDIVILGKPMGNGHPIGGVVVTEEITKNFENGMEFFSSFGGNPVSCEIGKAVLEVLEEEQLVLNAFVVGNYFKEELQNLKKGYPNVIGEVRGEGLFLGVEFVQVQHGTLQTIPNGNLAKNIMENLKLQYVLVQTDGPENNVIKIKPPMCFSKENAGETVQKIKVILQQLSN